MFLAKVSGFVITFAEWAAMGMPRREPEWVREIFEAHCANCPHYKPLDKTSLWSIGLCDLCGCHVSPEDESLLNKLVLPNTQCPDDPPRWLRAVDENPT